MAAASKFNSVVTNPGGTGSTITPTLSTHAVGDVIEIWVTKTGNAAWSAPAGWTIVRQAISPGTASTATVGTLIQHKVVSGDSLPLASPVCNLGATVTRHAVCRTIRGSDLEGVYTLSEWVSAITSGTNNPIRPPAVTTPAPEMFVTHYYCQRVATNAPEPTNYTQDREVITSGTLVTNISERTVADQQTVLANQDASPTSGGRWVGMISCVPSPDYPYYRSGSQAFNSNGTNVTPALPAGTSSNDNRGNKDLVVLTAQCAGVAPTVNTPAHWTLISEWSNTTSGGVTTVRKWRAVYTGTLDRQVNRTPSGEIFAYLSVYHNAHQTIPVGTSAVQQNVSSTTSTFPALPRTGTKATVQATCVADATPTFTAPSGWTERNDSQGVTCADQSFNATGTTASASFTLSSASPTLAGLMEVFSVASVITLTLTPAIASLTLTTFAPVVKLQITPGAASLSLTTFAPTVTTAAAQQYYRALTIDHALIPNTDQTDFPVLVSFTDDDLKSISNGGHVASTSGFDILFFSDAALTTQLSHEIEKYDPATGELIFWVKLPTISHSIDTTFYVKYGDSSITSSQEDSADTWSNDFLGVWHLNGASLGTAKNSVTGGDSTVSGPVAGSGQMDGGADYTGGTSTDSILTDLAVSQPANATYEIWARRTGDGGNGFGRMWVKGSVTNSVLQFYNDATTYAPAEVYIFSAQWDGASLVGNWSITRPSANTYHSLAVTYNNSSSSNDPLIYLNGAPATVTERVTPSGSLVDDSSEKFALGNRPVIATRKWNGQLDEFRVSSVIRSADWIATRFNNESDAAAFIAVGEELEVGDVLVTPAPATLALASFAPALIQRITPANASLTVTAFVPSVSIRVTVPSALLILTSFAPAVDVSADVSVTPATANLALTSFAVQLREVVTPANQSLSLTTNAPTLVETITPASSALLLTTFAPTITTNTILTPGVASLVLTRFPPVLVEQTTPQTASLTLSTFAPTVTAEADVTVTPVTAQLVLTGFVPQLHERQTPSAASLTITTFAPTITISADITVSPIMAALTLTMFSPSLRLVVTPAATTLSLTTFAPEIMVSADKTVEPAPAALTLQAFAPQLRLSVQPTTATLNLSTFAPTVTTGSAGTTVTPTTRLLTLTTYAPQLLTSSPSPRRTLVMESTRRTVIIERSSRTLFVGDGNREKTMV